MKSEFPPLRRFVIQVQYPKPAETKPSEWKDVPDDLINACACYTEAFFNAFEMAHLALRAAKFLICNGGLAMNLPVRIIRPGWKRAVHHLSASQVKKLREDYRSRHL